MRFSSRADADLAARKRRGRSEVLARLFAIRHLQRSRGLPGRGSGAGGTAFHGRKAPLFLAREYRNRGAGWSESESECELTGDARVTAAGIRTEARARALRLRRRGRDQTPCEPAVALHDGKDRLSNLPRTVAHASIQGEASANKRAPRDRHARQPRYHDGRRAASDGRTPTGAQGRRVASASHAATMSCTGFGCGSCVSTKGNGRDGEI